MKKLFDSVGARTSREQQSRTTIKDDLVLPRSIFRPTRTRESTPANANNSVLVKNPRRSWIFWAEPKSARIFTSEILKMNPTLRYFVSLTLKLASNQLHTSSSNWCQGSHSKLKETMIRVLVENNFDRDNVHWTSLTWRSKFSAVLLQLQCASKCIIITLLDDSNLNAFQTFWPRLNILRLVDVFVQQTRKCRVQTFHSTKFTNSALSLPHKLPDVFVKWKIQICENKI